MKKLFTYLAVVLFVVCLTVAPAGACWFCQTADGQYDAQSVSSDYSFHKSYCGCSNDWAEAGASGFVNGTLTTHASGLFYASESGSIRGCDQSDAWSYAKDFGRTSKAGAGASTEGAIITKGKAFGVCCGRELVDSTVTVNGDIFQNNYAAETGYGQGQGVDGGSSSFANFTASDRDVDTGCCYASDVNSISGNAEVQGHTVVNIDPYGSHRSFDARTRAMSDINVSGASMYTGSVGGNGGVGGLVQNNGAYAGGNASFAYTGAHSGNGAAQISASVYNGGNYSSVSVSGSSHAFGN